MDGQSPGPRSDTNFLGRNQADPGSPESESHLIPEDTPVSRTTYPHPWVPIVLALSVLAMFGVVLVTAVILMPPGREVTPQIANAGYDDVGRTEAPVNAVSEIDQEATFESDSFGSEVMPVTLDDAATLLGSSGLQPTITALVSTMESQVPPEYYTGVLGLAYDTKRRADLTGIATALMMYQVENGNVPDGVSGESVCIGNEPPCMDLYGQLVPGYIPEPYFDPVIGTAANTGYTVAVPSDGMATFRLTAVGSSGETISVSR